MGNEIEFLDRHLDLPDDPRSKRKRELHVPDDVLRRLEITKGLKKPAEVNKQTPNSTSQNTSK